jgi:quercetin 2,3-dioxygenase
LKGSIKLGKDPKVHQVFHTLVLSAEDNEDGVNIEALEDGTDLCLVTISIILVVATFFDLAYHM